MTAAREITAKAGPTICIIDYGMGNLSSVVWALHSLGCRAEISNNPERIAVAEALILPGVGAFGEAMLRIRSGGLIPVLERRVFEDRVPFLGICLGMQLLGKQSTEGGIHQGLGWIDAQVDRIPDNLAIRVPHIGWNEVAWAANSPINASIEQNSHFYFNHSFHMTMAGDGVAATTNIGEPILAAVTKDNIWGVQFHPEKSQNNGRRLLRNFLNFISSRQPALRHAC
ncbi:MAG: imidazole glycerol phosphate synthase subunit HisH [Rhodospirillaceae bacterium]|nr:imidazole glycerol phosphate synthase subunit HisH [Rhodospirillaceae bacterium]